MSFKMPTGKKLDSMLDKLSAKDIKEIRTQFELDVQKENQKETDMPNKETMSSIYEAIADMSDHHLKVASSYEELEKILDERNMNKYYQNKANYYHEKATQWHKQSDEDEAERERLVDIMCKIYDLTGHDQKETVDDLVEKLDQIKELTKKA